MLSLAGMFILFLQTELSTDWLPTFMWCPQEVLDTLAPDLHTLISNYVVYILNMSTTALTKDSSDHLTSYWTSDIENHHPQYSTLTEKVSRWAPFIDYINLLVNYISYIYHTFNYLQTLS